MATVLAGANGFYMAHRLGLWYRFGLAGFWWVHAMLGVWVIFMALWQEAMACSSAEPSETR